MSTHLKRILLVLPFGFAAFFACVSVIDQAGPGGVDEHTKSVVEFIMAASAGLWLITCILFVRK